MLASQIDDRQTDDRRHIIYILYFAKNAAYYTTQYTITHSNKNEVKDKITETRSQYYDIMSSTSSQVAYAGTTLQAVQAVI